MQVFLDSNIFFNQWYLESSQLRLLIHFLNNEGYTLIVSDLVVEEVENKHRSLAHDSYSALEKDASRFNTFFPQNNIHLPLFPEMPIYDLRSQLEDRVDFVDFIGYENVSQSEVVKRAISTRRPFKANEKGYRDTLIWLSLLQHLKNEEIDGEVAFISTNTNDFMDSDRSSFHPDLIDDISSLGLHCRITAFSSLSDFLSKNVDSHAHLIDEAKVDNLAEDYLETESLMFLEKLDKAEVMELETHLFGSNRVLANISSISAEMIEGMEDLDFHGTSDLGGDDVFIVGSYNLRIVHLDLEVPVRDYEVYKDAIQKSGLIFDVGFYGDFAVLRTFVRPVFQVSFVFNVVTEECDGYTVDQLSFYRNRG